MTKYVGRNNCDKESERTQIHFLSDVLIAVASLDLKVPIVFRGGENLFACGGSLFFLTDQLQNKLKTYCRTPRDPQRNSISDNLNSPLTETISLGFFSHFYSANLTLDNSNLSLTGTKFRLP